MTIAVLAAARALTAEYGATIHKTRRDAGLTQWELFHRTDVPVPVLSRIETGSMLPNDEQAAALEAWVQTIAPVDVYAGVSARFTDQPQSHDVSRSIAKDRRLADRIITFAERQGHRPFDDTDIWAALNHTRPNSVQRNVVARARSLITGPAHSPCPDSVMQHAGRIARPDRAPVRRTAHYLWHNPKETS